MKRKAVSGIMLTLLFVGTLMFILNPIYAASTTRKQETPIASENALRLDSTSPTPEWNQTYGGADWDWGNSVAETVDDGYALAGYRVFWCLAY